MMEGLGADSEEKREPVSDIDIAVADSLKVLDLKRPIREADIRQTGKRDAIEPETPSFAAPFEGRHSLRDSYNFVCAAVWKTYVRSGTETTGRTRVLRRCSLVSVA